MKPEFKIDGDMIVIEAPISIGLDKDGDGVKSIEAGGNLFIKIKALEAFDEMAKSVPIFEMIKEKMAKLVP
jgi:hypothetical protein